MCTTDSDCEELNQALIKADKRADELVPVKSTQWGYFEGKTFVVIHITEQK